jgi:DNA-binding response OmpR family regulator
MDVLRYSNGRRSDVARILVIEDDQDFRSVLCAMLRGAGHSVIEAENGRTGLAHADDVDLAITDVLMPEVDGIEFILGMKARNPDLPVIAISGGSADLAAAVTLHLSEALGAADVLCKPFRRDELLAAIEKALRRRELTAGE